ncbi:hypothetical protein RYX56_05770 [Alkalihalophilus lindianensis]|uniref:Fur-regulated basic protein A n=1 Tax=Alkalihalophilus lindianensis TaxID=1630542 RepID=A0ABU3X7E6_9BACI|nr:hypothetical protein [Alkalihalophilus lindianensis]MDV2683816.1 hypothetical protein [Alkalihalophilus lindianensis]MDV2683882.1 hypothetical protein [Alkalihalophilus lindianensis]
MENNNTAGRNRYDLIMELVAIHINHFGVSDSQELEEIYKKYHALVRS